MNAEFTPYAQPFRDDGFVVIPQFLRSDELRELRDNVARYIRDVVPRLPQSKAFFHDYERPETLKQLQYMSEYDPYFAEYQKHSRWTAVAATLLGEPVKPRGPEWFDKPPGVEHPTPPHQDNYYFCLRPPSVVTCWLALEAVDRDNSCLHYLPQSHLQAVRDHAATSVLGFSQGISDITAEERARGVPVELAAGDLAVHHGNTIHWADCNRSNRRRPAFAMVFQGESCQRDEEAYARYMARLSQQHAEMGVGDAT